MIVIGTAGHIDHGKSSIVLRLTGTDPDRLPEEKARGMTIDLGFAFYNTKRGDDVAFVDVPGHERFVRTMIAGAGGFDAVMLVVAADDGWMPQSQEHFEILKLLRINHGFMVINKSDLADADWLALLEQELREHTKGSFLSEAPIFRISAQTGAGFDELRSYLDQLSQQIESRNDIGKARLYIDRVFVQHGIGGVVTGTMRGGRLSMGQAVSIWPGMENAKVRSLQSAGHDVPQVGPGSRTACSFTGIDKEALVRGGVVSDRTDLTYFKENPVLALQVEMLPTAMVALEDRRKVLLLVGTSEAEGEIRLFDAEAIQPGQSGLAFFKSDDPLYTLVADRVVFRLPTPAITLGGAMVLDHLPQFPRRRDLAQLEYLKGRISGTLEDLVKSELVKKPMCRYNQLLEYADRANEQIQAVCDDLVTSWEAARFGEWVYDVKNLAACADKLVDRLTTILVDKSHLKGLNLDLIAANSPFDRESTEVVVDYLVSEGRLVQTGDSVNLAGRGMSLKGLVKEAHEKIMAALVAEPYAPPSLTSFASLGKPYQEAIKFIIDSKEGHKCGVEFIILQRVWNEVVGYIRERLNSTGGLAVSDLKDRFGFTRKYAIPIMEESDRLKLTRRDGDVRRKGERFEESEFTV